jgi:signal transduction histidine kinase
VRPGDALLARLRLRLAAWYLATLVGIVLLLGVGLFLAIRHQVTGQLRESLRQATAQVERAARTRELEASVAGRVIDALEELRIPDRQLFLTDTLGMSQTPTPVPAWIATAAIEAARRGRYDGTFHRHHETRLRLHAERFVLDGGMPLIAVAVASEVELEDRYAALIAAFGIAAATAVLLVAAGGWLLVRESTAPIERNIAQMRRFMADAAHELRTPITVLRTQAEVALQRDRSAPEYVGALRTIEAESDRLARLVDQLLTLARADAGEQRPQLARLFLDDIVSDAIGSANAMAGSRDVQLALEEFGEAAVMGDPELLRQLVMILLDNAIKFSPPGGRVRIAVAPTVDGAELRISDDGPGIAPHDTPHLFDRFYRGDPARQRGTAASGAGLGLAIAQWIAGIHAATITVASEPGHGAAFTVRFGMPGAPVSLP